MESCWKEQVENAMKKRRLLFGEFRYAASDSARERHWPLAQEGKIEKPKKKEITEARKDIFNFPRRIDQKEQPVTWHPPWKLTRVISGHDGWVRAIAVDPSNEWFASSGNDRLIKVWDLASGTLRLSLTGHVSPVRGLEISHRHPYLFSCSEDCEVKCWDLEKNMAIRNYHGHLSSVHTLALHPSLDILATGGGDASVRLWDMRSKANIHTFTGHTNAVCSLIAQNGVEPQFISGSMDQMVRLWDLKQAKCGGVLTHHKKSIRAMAFHPVEYKFVSCSADDNKVWWLPGGKFERGMGGHESPVHACAIKESATSSVLVGGTDDGYLHFWDWGSGKRFQSLECIPQPGSLSCENGVMAMSLDMGGVRLITGECDKTIKIYKEDPDAVEEK